MPGESNFGRLYDALKTDQRISTDLSREDFISAMEAPGDKGYHNRLGLFNSLKTEGFTTFNTYEEFAAGMGLHAVSKPKANVGNKDTQVRTFASTKNQSRQQQQKKQSQNTPLSREKANAMAAQVGNMLSETRTSLHRTQNKLDYAKANSGLNVSKVTLGAPKGQVRIGQNNKVVAKNPSYNPETGKFEQTYITESGNEYSDRNAADMEQNQLDMFHSRMMQNGLDPTNKDDVQKQAQIDFDEPVRNAMDEIWAEAERKYKEDEEQNAKDIYGGNPWLHAGREMHVVDASMNNQANLASHMMRFDLQKMMDEAWVRSGKDMTEKFYQQLAESNSGKSEAQLRQEAAKEARKYSDSLVLGYAKNKNMPKSTLDFFAKTFRDANLLRSLQIGSARKQAGTLGDLVAYKQAMSEYGDKHKFVQGAGNILGIAFDPTTILSTAIGGFAAKGALWLGGRLITPGAASIGSRLLGSSIGGKIGSAIIGSGANFATFQGIKEGENQFVHGGYVNSDTGKVEDYSLEDILSEAQKGLVIGSIIGPIAPLLGNVATKAVKATSNVWGKAGIRAGEVATSTIAEGTIFATPEWIENAQKSDDDPTKRSAWDIWTGETLTMAGFKASHGIKSAPRVVSELMPVKHPRTTAERTKNRMGFVNRIRMRLDGHPEMIFTKTDKDELRRNGYGELSDLFTYDPSAKSNKGNKEQQSHETGIASHPEFDGWESMQHLMQDKNVSEAVRAKAYYLLTDRKLPMSSVAAWGVDRDYKGNIYVKSFGSDGQTITCRTYKDEKSAQKEVERIQYQVELNGVDIGERYKEAAANAKVVQAAVEFVAPDADFATVMRNYKAVKEGDKDAIAAYGKMVEDIDRAIEANKTMADGERPEAIRASIKEQTGIDIDKTLKKLPEKRTKAEQEAIQNYVEQLYPAEHVENSGYEKKLSYEDAINSDDSNNDSTGNSQIEEPTDNDPIANAYSQAQEDVERRTHKQTRLIHPAVLKNGKNVCIVSGDVTMLKDGSGVDKKNSSDSIVVCDTETGDLTMVSPDQIGSVSEPVSPEIVGSVREAQIDDAYNVTSTEIVPGENSVDEEGNRFTVKAVDGDRVTITDKEGQEQTYEDGTFGQMVDGGMLKREADDPNATQTGSPEGDGVPTWGVGSRIEINGHEYKVLRVDEGNDLVSLEDENGKDQPIPWLYSGVKRALSDGRARIIEENTNIEPKPIGKGVFGNIYDQFKGKAKAAIDFLKKLGSGEAVAALHHKEVGDISLVWGNDKAGLKKILRKHPEVVDNLQGILDGMHVVQSSENRIILESDTHKAVVSREFDGTPREQWLLTAYEKKNASGGSIDIVPEPTEGKQNGTAPLQDNSSADKDTEQYSTTQAEAQENVSMPMRRVGNGKNAREEEDWLATSPERGHDYIFSESGLDAETANTFVENKLLEAKKSLDKVKKNEPKIGTSIAEYKSAKQEHDARVAEAQKEVDYWNDVKAVHAKRAFDAGQATAEDVSPTVDSAHQVDERISQKWNDANKIDGDADEITLPNGESVNGHYVLTESGAASASHQATNGFAETDGFPVDENGQSVNDRDYKRDQEAQEVTRSMASDYDSRALQSPVVVSREGVVLSGNGRTMAGEIAAQNGTDKKYNDYLRTHANKYGFTEEQVNGFEHPRVLFVPDADMPYTAETFAKFNQREQKSQNKTEQAVKMGKVVDDALFGRVMQTIGTYDTLGEFYGDDAATHGVVKELAAAGVIPQTEMAQLFDGGKLSEAGQAMVEGVLIGKVFQANPDAVREITEVKSMRQSVMAALQEIVTNSRLGGGYDLSQELAEAIDLVYKARKAGYKAGMRVSEYAGQGNLFQLEDGATVADYTNAAVMMLADVLNDGRTTQLKKVMAFYNRQAADAAQGIGDMFAGGVKTKEDIINEVNEALNNGQNYNRNAASASDGQSGGNEGGEQGDVASPGDQGGERGLREVFDGLAAKLKSAEGEERMRVLGEMRDGIARFAEENGYPVPEFLLTREDFLAAVPENDKARVEQWLNDGWHCPAYYEKGKVYYFVEGCDNFDKDILETLSHEYTHADNAEFPENVNALVYAVEDTHEVSQDELIDILETLSNSSHYETDAERLESEGKNPNKMLADEVIAHVVARMARDGEQVLDGITKNPTLQFIIKRAYKVRENERRHNILASEASERSSKTIESSEANSGNSQSVAEGESRLGRHGRSARSEVETGEQSSNGRSTVTVGEEVAAPSSEGAKDDVTEGEKSSVTGDVVPSGRGEKDNLRMQKADGKSAQPPTREETILRDAVIDHMKGSGLDVLGTEDGQRVLDMVNGRDVRLSAKQKRALETATIADESTNNATVVSSAAGAKVQNNLEILAEGYQKRPNKTKGFITDLSRSLGLKQHESSQYGTFVTGNGKTVTIRVSNHNARVSNFDRNGENDGISIVISSHKNKGLNNDGDAHVTEFFYPKQSLERAGSKPLSEVIRSFSEALNSGVFKDTTGLAERQEVNNIIIREHRVYHGSGMEFDAFDHSHMGEGEGAQAYGWGTYVTEVEGIGRTYAKKAVASNSVIHRVYRYLGNGKSATNAMMNPSTHKNTILRLIDKAIATREHILGGTTLDPLIETMKKELKELKVAKDLLTKEQQRILYTVEIPNDNGNNYLDWKGHPAESLLKDVGSFLESNGFEMVQDSPARYEKGESTIVLNPNATGADLYAELQEALGSDKKASQALAELGYTGIKYPADNMRGGREDGAKNYVIFNEKDAKITDHVRFFRTANGEAYGFTVGGKIYIDPKIANSETPVHEYAHLWASALKANNPKEWQNVVNLMKGTSVWAEVKKAYPELKTNDEIADEVLATYSGRRGAERLREEAKKISDGEGSVFDKAKAVSALERVRQAIEKFWKAVADFLHIHYTSAEQVADQVMKDLLNGVDPRKFMGEKAQKEKMRYQFIGEQGAERADHAEEVTTRLDNLSVAREMEVAKKDAKAIKLATGWERGADGKWRYEIPDLKYFGKGDAGYKKARGKQPWSKELDGLSDRIFDGEELSESEYQRFDELSQEEENFKKDYLNREKPHLADWVENDELFKAYPDLKRVELMFTDQLPANMGGSYNKRDHTIVVNTNYVGDIASVLAHEVQHAIQKIEGFARGGNPESMQERFDAAKEEWRARAWADALRDKADEMGEHYNQAAVEKALIDEYKEMGMDNDEWMPNKETRMKGFNYFARGYADRSLDEDIKNFRLNESTRSEFSPYVEYTKLGGEVESRNVEHRMNMTPEERMASLAAETEDVSREDQIFLMSGDGGNANSEIPQEMGTGDDYSEFAKEHGVDADMVKDYASGMKTGNLQKADIALAEIRRTMRVANRGMKLSEFGKLFRPVQKELAERYGDIEKLRQEYIDATMRERGVMEAARKRAEEEEAKRKAHIEEMSLLTTEELDKRYFDAIEIGDDAAAREILDEAARRKGYDDTESNYQGVGAWSAPSNPGYESDAARRADVEDNAPDVNIEDIALGYSLVGEKYWQEPRKYMQTDATAIESVNAIREAIAAVRRGEKNVKVKVYRAVPTSVKEGNLRNGDWVTPSKDYAKMHGEHRLGGDYRIIEDEVSVNELWWDGNDSREWGFDDGKGYKYKNVENSRKLNDLVTRDDNGEIIPPSKRFDENVEDVRYRTSEELDQINQKFNERLDELVSNPNQKDKVLHLGRSSEFLKDGGISDAEIVLEYDKLVRKSSEDYSNHHPYSAEDIHDLPIAIHNPIALFENTKGKGGFVILTELEKDGRNFIAALRTTEQNRKGGVLLTVNEITTLYPKAVRGIIHWINQGKITNVDKEKALHFIEALQPHAGTTITSEELLSAANVVKDFETLQLSASEKAKQQAANDLAQQMHVEGEVEVVTSTEGLTDRQAKAKGWYDVRTGRVTIVLPNNKNVEDVRETVFHEVVTHKGLRSLVGDENFNTFLDNVYNNAEEKIQQSIDELSQKYGGDKRKATEEYMAGLAEDGEFAKPENQSFFRKVKDFLVDLLRKVGIKLGFKLTDNDLRYILWRSWKNLKSGGRESLFDKAEDVVKQNELGQTDEARSEHGENGLRMRDGDEKVKSVVEAVKGRLERLNEQKNADRDAAVRAIGGSLRDLHKAMREQRTYDLHTVDSITHLAKDMLKHGLLHGLSDYEASRLFSAATNVHGKKDIKPYVQKVMDIMVNNQLHNLKDSLSKLLMMRGKKVNASGVEVQGGLDLDGQHLADTIWRGIGMTEEDIQTHLSEAQNRMDDENKVIAHNASVEYQAYQILQNYHDGVVRSKSEEQTLRDELKKAKEDYDAKRMSFDDYVEFREATANAIRENRMDRIEAYRDVIAELGGEYGESAQRAKDFREREKERINEIHHNANSDMEGRPCNEHHQPTKVDKAANNPLLGLLTRPMGTFDQMMRMFGRKNVRGEGYLWNRYMRGWNDARDNEVNGYRGAIEELDNKVKEVFGRKGMKWSDLFAVERKLPKGYVSFMDGGVKRTHELSQGNLLYIYMVNKMTDGKMKLRKMGISEEDVEQIADFLDPRLKLLGDWLQDEFLVKKREKYNEVHERLFGASMADIENYFPLKILKNAIAQETNLEDRGQGDEKLSTIVGSVKKRTRNALPLDVMDADAFAVVLDHIKEMEHFAAFGEWNRDLNTLLSYNIFRVQVQNMASVYGSGKELWQAFEKVCQIAAGVYRKETSKTDKFAMIVAKGVTGAKVTARIFTAFKQLTSYPAYLSEANPFYLIRNLINPVDTYKAWKWSMENLPQLRERWKGRFAGDPILESNRSEGGGQKGKWERWRENTIELAAKYGMSPNAFVDALTISMGTKAVYDTRLAKYKEMGYSDDAADKRAKQDASIAYNQTQQSSEGAYMSAIQSDRTWLTAMVTAFRNSSISYTRQLYDAMRRMKDRFTPGYKGLTVEFMRKQMERDGIDPDKASEYAKKEYRRGFVRDMVRVGVFGFLLPFTWNLVGYASYLIFGDDDKKKKEMWSDIFTHTIFGSIEGLVGGDALSAGFNSLWRSAFNGEKFESNKFSKDMPVASDIDTMWRDWKNKGWQAGVTDVFNILVQSAIGVNPQTLTDAAVAIYDFCGADEVTPRECALLVMRIFNCPKSQTDKVYFDELGMTAKEAQKLSVEQIAERYADYKMKSDAPLLYMTYDDEAKKKRGEFYKNNAEEEAKENASNEVSTKEIVDLQNEYEEMKKKIASIKALEDEDRSEFLKQMGALVSTSEYMRYQIMADYNGEMNKLTKKFLRAKTTEERKAVIKDMQSARERWLEMLHQSNAIR